MVEFLQLPEDRRRQIIAQVNARTGMSVKAVEKDWWVTLVLKALFSLPMRSHFIFKGGTSLSKAWKLIERFSEDIDIALAPEAFGREYLQEPSHSYVKKLKKEGCAYTSTVIKKALVERLQALGVPEGVVIVEAEEINPLIPDKDPQTLYVRYPSLYDPNPYIADAVKAEFGVRALKEPFAEVPILSIIAEVFPNASYTETPFTVTAVEPRKTFMEKLFLLHERFANLQEGAMLGERQSRHLSDLGRMTTLGVAQQVFDDPGLYGVLLAHRKHYVRLKNIDYASMQMHGLSIIPPPAIMGQFREDYETMRSEMIYGNAPEFDTLIDQLKELNGLLAMDGQTGAFREVVEQARLKLGNKGLSAEAEVKVEGFLVKFISRKERLIFHSLTKLP